jgi:hypothetical protein
MCSTLSNKQLQRLGYNELFLLDKFFVRTFPTTNETRSNITDGITTYTGVNTTR